MSVTLQIRDGALLKSKNLMALATDCPQTPPPDLCPNRPTNCSGTFQADLTELFSVNPCGILLGYDPGLADRPWVRWYSPTHPATVDFSVAEIGATGKSVHTETFSVATYPNPVHTYEWTLSFSGVVQCTWYFQLKYTLTRDDYIMPSISTYLGSLYNAPTYQRFTCAAGGTFVLKGTPSVVTCGNIPVVPL
jgi:hypothetical protein